MPRTLERQETKPEDELKVALRLLSGPERTIGTQFGIHRLADLAKENPVMVQYKTSGAMLDNPTLARNLNQIAKTLPVHTVVKRIDPEVEATFAEISLSRDAKITGALQEKLRLKSMANGGPMGIGKRITESPIKTTERVYSGSTDEWSGKR